MNYNLFTTKDVREYIRKICENKGVDYCIFSIGCGKTYNKNKRRYEYRTNINQGDDKKLKYAIKYYSNEAIFVIWQMVKKRRNVFSVSYSDAQEALEKNNNVEKAIEYRGWDTEEVIVIPLDFIEPFICALGSE